MTVEEDMARVVEHVERDSVRPGMAVMVKGREIGQVEDLVLQPDGQHILRLITSHLAPNRRRAAIPIEWVRGIRDGHVVLLVDDHDLELLPEYSSSIPGRAAILASAQAPAGRQVFEDSKH
jgi:sporulation protein YlmC with PRC-barrel domain